MSPASNEDPPRERSLAHYLRIARRQWVLIVIPAIVAGCIGALLAARQPDTFRSTATVRVVDPALSGGTGRAADLDRVLETALQVIESEPMQESVFADVPEPAAEAFSDVSVARVGETVLVDISVTASDADSAAEIAQRWAETYVESEVARTVGTLDARIERIEEQIADLESEILEIDERIAEEVSAVEARQDAQDATGLISGNETPTLRALTNEREELSAEQGNLRREETELQLEAALQASVVEVAFPAQVPDGPIGGNAGRSGALAAVLGLMVGIGFAIARDELDDRVHSPADLSLVDPEIPLLAAVPGRIARGRSRRPVFGAQPSADEAYRSLRANLEYIASMREPGAARGLVVVITSPLEAEGKSTTAANVAAALALADRSVALVDADLRRGALHEQFSVRDRPGLIDMVTAGRSLEKTWRSVDVGGGRLRLVTGGRHPDPAKLFTGARFEQVVAALARAVDYVIIDAPPALPVSDARLLGRLADGALLVVGAGQTRKPYVRAAVDVLRQFDVAVMGLVLNGIGRTPHGGYYDHRDVDSAIGRRRLTLPLRPAAMTGGAPKD